MLGLAYSPCTGRSGQRTPGKPVVYWIGDRAVSKPSARTPKYRLHKPTNLAVVTLGGRDLYLGRHGTAESRAEYARLLGEWLLNRRLPDGPVSCRACDPTVNEVILAFLEHAQGYYVKNGEPTSESANIALALRPLRQLYGHTTAREFGPVALKAVRKALIDSGICRNEVNKRVGKIVRAFKWAVGEELIPSSVHHGLTSVPGLRKGRSDARESKPVGPVPDASVAAVRPHVPRQVWAMIELQSLTGMRPGEVCSIRSADLDTSGRVWIYVHESHKSEHHMKHRRVFLGPRAREVLRGWLRPHPLVSLFSPAETSAETWAERRRSRKTPLTPSQLARTRRSRPIKSPGSRYSTSSYRRAIAEACR
jgi:integrase